MSSTGTDAVTDLGSPPSEAVEWVIRYRLGGTEFQTTGNGQTAYYAWRQAKLSVPFGMCEFAQRKVVISA